MAIAVKLDDLLHERRMTLTELAERVDITLANLSILKTGKARAIRFSTLEAICAALACQPGDLLAIPTRLRRANSRAPLLAKDIRHGLDRRIRRRARRTAGERSEVSLIRLYVLRATYLLLMVGLGGMIVPQLLSHEPLDRGVIPSLLGAVWLLAFIGLRYPLQMLPLLMFEFAWKIDLAARLRPAAMVGRAAPADLCRGFFNIVAGVILMPLVIPWAYVWRHYVKRPGARWR